MIDRIKSSFEKYSIREFNIFTCLRLLVSTPEFKIICVYIISNELYKNKQMGGVQYALNRLLRHYRYKYGVGISPKTEIGNGFSIAHCGGIVINHESVIGENCCIRQCSTIGNDGKDNKNSPIIGNNVDIGVNSVIIGRITIGDNVIIGAGSVVVKDIPSNSIVVGNPAHVIKRYSVEANEWIAI